MAASCPDSRRGFLRGLACLPLVGAVAAHAAASPDDALLLELISRWAVAQQAHRLADARRDQGTPALPPLPDELLVRPSDFRLLGSGHCRDAESYADERCWIEHWRGSLERFRGDPELPAFAVAVLARFDEIDAAHAGYWAEVRRARDVAGVESLEAEADRAYAVAIDLRRRLAASPARTEQGAHAKFAAAVQILEIEALQENLDDLLEDTHVTPLDAILASAILDMARQGSASSLVGKA